MEIYQTKIVENKKQNKDKLNPLVSVIVITYNSSKYILDTLESIKNQTYANLEIIITDDFSTDETVLLCHQWIENNRDRFSKTCILTAKQNNGITANCNIGVQNSKGIWLKLLAGDDCLSEDALSKMIDFTRLHPNCEILHTPVLKFKSDSTKKIVFEKKFSDHPKVLNDKVPAFKQFEILTKGCVVNAPAVFMKNTIIRLCGEFDTEIPNCEDWPYWLKITKLGIQFYYINEALAYYRIREDSIYTSGSKYFYIGPFYKTEKKIFEKYIEPNISFQQKYISKYDFFLKDFFSKSSISLITKFLFTLLRLPVLVYHRLNRN